MNNHLLAQDTDKEERFKIRITQHGEPFGAGYPRWWYWNKIGLEYEASEDQKRNELYWVHDKEYGTTRKKHVLKTDCEKV